MTDFSKYGTPVVAKGAKDFSKYGTPVATPTSTPDAKDKVGVPTSVVGGAAEGLGAKLPLMAIDYMGKKFVDRMPENGTFMGLTKKQLQENLARSGTQSEQYDKTFGKDQNPNAYGAAEAVGTVGGLVVPVKQGITAIKNIPEVASMIAKKNSGIVDDLAGKIVQGDVGDISKAKPALMNIDANKVNTYKDLVGELDKKITEGSGMLDKVLETNPAVKKLPDLTSKIKDGEDTINHNYVEDAINQLKEHYAKVNDQPNLQKVIQIGDKANSEGLSVKELNDIARMHGADLNAFNANGQAASGITKQAAENTRAGLKTTARDIFGNKIYKDTDAQLSSMIRTRKLVSDMAEKVNDLQQRVQARGFGERAGNLIGKVINTVGLGSPKGLVESFLGRGTGLKTLNPIDLEKALSSNLKKLQGLYKEGGSEADLIKSLEDFLAKVPKKPSIK